MSPELLFAHEHSQRAAIVVPMMPAAVMRRHYASFINEREVVVKRSGDIPVHASVGNGMIHEHTRKNTNGSSS
jgi:hypothetical protein